MYAEQYQPPHIHLIPSDMFSITSWQTFSKPGITQEEGDGQAPHPPLLPRESSPFLSFTSHPSPSSKNCCLMLPL